MSVTIICVPYHVGILDHRVGLGPSHLLQPVTRELERHDFVIQTEIIPHVDDFEGEIGRSLELLRRVSRSVERASLAGSFPLLLAGNCNTSAGVAAGLHSAGYDSDKLGIVWLDAHHDAGTPDDVMHGYFDGMGVSMVNGRSWKALMSTVPGHTPIPMSRVIYCGVRHERADEKERLRSLGAHFIDEEIGIEYAQRLRSEMENRVEAGMVSSSIIHVDLDVLDPTKVGLANEFPSPGGLTEDELVSCMVAAASLSPSSLTVASFMPGLKGGDAVAKAAIRGIVEFMVARRESSKTPLT